MHRGELEVSSDHLWGSSWVLGRVLGGAQAVPGTFAGDLKNSEQNVGVYGIERPSADAADPILSLSETLGAWGVSGSAIYIVCRRYLH